MLSTSGGKYLLKLISGQTIRLIRAVTIRMAIVPGRANLATAKSQEGEHVDAVAQ